VRRGLWIPIAAASFAALLPPASRVAAAAGSKASLGAATAPGRLVIVGGALADDNESVYRAILNGRQGDGPFCVIPTASGVPRESMESARATLARYAAPDSVTGVFLAEENAADARDPAMAERIEGCSGFFFTGGDQSRVVRVFLPEGDTTNAFRALRSKWRAGAVVSGSSAGAAMMSGVMIGSGTSAGAVAHGVSATEDGDGVFITSGMGFFTRAILDQHFLSRGRVGRLIVATLATDTLPVGLGIDENTALVVEGDQAKVVGASGVVVVDARHAARVSSVRGSGIVLTLAGAGDVIDLDDLRVTRGVGKGPLAPVGSQAAAEDPFARWAFLHIVVGMARSSAVSTRFDVGGAVLTLRKGQGFSAVRAPGDGVQGEPAELSAGPFVVALTSGEG